MTYRLFLNGGLRGETVSKLMHFYRNIKRIRELPSKFCASGNILEQVFSGQAHKVSHHQAHVEQVVGERLPLL